MASHNPRGERREAGKRLTALDGLRGVAASVVVIHHVLLASVPALAAVYFVGTHPHLSSLEWALVRTPLHIIWAGPEFVIVFFVLSGFVLTLPALSRGLRLADYYPRRFVRLYVPVWGAVAVALVLHVVISHHAIPQASIWLDNHSVGIHLGSVAHDCTLIFGAGGFDTTSVLWSLRWEVIFSLGLPVVVWLMLRAPAALVVLGCLAISAADPTSQWAIYLPPFVVGAALATQFERIHQIRASAGATLFLTAVVVGGLTSNWWLGSSTLAQHIAPASVTVGAALAVLLPLASRRTQQILETSPVQWLGTRSYSLYLVHEPVVVCIAFLLHGRGWLLLLVLSIPAALALTEAFFRLVERPSHRLSRRVGGFATKHLPAAFQPTVNASS